MNRIIIKLRDIFIGMGGELPRDSYTGYNLLGPTEVAESKLELHEKKSQHNNYD